jgi:DNA-directed RNA polymerase specialized sigma24 family protein
MADPRAGAELVGPALAGSPAAVRALVNLVAPVVHARIARALTRSATGRRQGRDLRQEIEDFAQEVFAAIFADQGRALRAWDPERGLSLVNFVGLVAEHQVASILRSGRRNPWTEEPTLAGEIDLPSGSAEGAEERVYSREVLVKLDDRLRVELSPRGLHLFRMLVVEERSVPDVCAETSMTPDAVYAWRSRLGKLVRKLGDEIARGLSDPGLAPRRSEGEERSAS